MTKTFRQLNQPESRNESNWFGMMDKRNKIHSKLNKMNECLNA